MIITAQPFFNELDALELKFEELKGVVDLHVVVEAARTFTGKPKRLLFAENRHRFARFPVRHIVAELPEHAASPWDREAIQYKAVLEAVRAINPLIAIWVDADEVPAHDVVDRFRRSGHTTMTLEMEQLLFFLDRTDQTQRWTNGKIGYFDRACVHQPWRGETHHPVMSSAGWHLEYFGARYELLDKLEAVSHAPEPGCQNMRRLVTQGEFPGIERTRPLPIELLPRTVQANPAAFAPWFHDRGQGTTT